MTADPDAWCLPKPGQSTEDFIAQFVAARPALTGAEVASLRAVFRVIDVARDGGAVDAA